MKKVLSVLVVLFVSFQLNAQWVTQSSGTSKDFASISAIDNNNCWIAGFGSAVVRTTNGGTNWSYVGLTAINGVSVDISSIYAVDANTCLASLYTSTTTYVYKTTNGGSNWSQVFSQSRTTITGFEGIRAIYMTSATNGFMVGDPVNLRWSLWKTTNGGSTWDSTGLLLMASNSSESAAFHCLYVNGTNIWFGTGSSKIYYSSDYGSTWSSQNTQSLTSTLDVWFSGTTGIAAGTAGTNFEGPGALYTSSNSGATWIQAPYPGSGTITAATAQGSNFIYSTLFGAIYLSTNSGISFSKVDSISVTGHAYYDIRIARNGTTVWACGPGGIIRKGSIAQIPTHGLQLWVRADNGVVLNGSTVSRWTDQSGNGNDAVQTDVSRQPIVVSNELNHQPVLRFDGINDRLGLTGSKGMTQISFFIVEKPVQGATGPNPYYPIVFGDNDNDYGLSMQNSFSNNSPDEIDPFTYDQSWVRANAPGISAFGQWKIISVTADKNMYNTTLRANGVDAVIAPQGSTNSPLSIPLGNSTGTGHGGIGCADGEPLGRLIFKGDIAEVIVYDTVLSNSARLAIEHYLKIKYLPDTTTAVNDLKSVIQRFSLEQNYPNPFNPTTTIRYSIPNTSHVELKIYDMLGRQVSTLVSKEQNAGDYKMQFDGSSLSSGVYIYRIQAGEFSDSKKLLLLK